MDDKRAKGLCFWCDEKFGMGHRCGNKQLHRLEIWDDHGDNYEERMNLWKRKLMMEKLVEEIWHTFQTVL